MKLEEIKILENLKIKTPMKYNKYESSDKSNSWKNWIIKKLLSNDSNKEDILNFIANEGSNNELEDIDDNNEKNLIKNILKLIKSVEDLMVPRSEIIAVEDSKSYSEILEILTKKVIQECLCIKQI